MKQHETGKGASAGKGYYIALTLCALAIGISGWLFLSSAVQSSSADAEQTVSAPITAVEPPPVVQRTVVPTVGSAEGASGDEAVKNEARRIVVSPVKGETLMGYSADELQYNAATRDWRLHTAVDIAAAGQKVQAAMAGTVTDVYDDDWLGTTVVLKHDGGYETRYSNLTAMPTVKKGDVVKAGDVIGAVGDTAILESASAPHLHFEVLRGGKPIDPKEFLG